eukprot:9162318-Prorocentrum_lima.AAC.1
MANVAEQATEGGTHPTGLDQLATRGRPGGTIVGSPTEGGTTGPGQHPPAGGQVGVITGLPPTSGGTSCEG